MNIIFTTCTYNHIGRAYSLADSIAAHSPDTKLVIGLLDRFNEPFASAENFEILNSADLGLPFLDEMTAKYSMLELNSALKPFYASYFLNQFAENDHIIYLDSDILLYSDLVAEVKEVMASYSIFLSPHAMSSTEDEKHLNDRNILRSGVYNAGFFAVKNDVAGRKFVDWWKSKLRNYCFFDPKNGTFAEQLWLNLVPLYHERVFITQNPGYNVAYWNLHERNVTYAEGRYLINGIYPLIFFHFSGAGTDCFERNSLSVYQERYSFTNRPDVVPLFEHYIAALKKHQFDKFNAYTTINKGFKIKSKPVIKALELYRRMARRFFYK